jgi:uncharacterized protein
MPKTTTAMDEFAVRLSDQVIRYRWLVILVTFAVALLMAFGASQLKFSNNYRAFFSDANPELQAFEDFQDTYTKSDNFLFVIVPKGGDVFNQQTMALVEELTEKSWQVPFSSRVDSISNFQHTRAEEDDLIVENLVEGALDLSDIDLEARRQIAVHEPLLAGQIVAKDSRAVAVNIVVQYPQLSLTEVPETVKYVRALRGEMQAKYPDQKILLTGISMLNSAFEEAGYSDATGMVPKMYLLLLVLMAVMVRSIAGTLTTVLMIGFASIMGMGAAGFAGVALTPIALSAPTVILTLAIADAVHILITMRNAMRAGMDKRAAIRESVRVNFLAVMVTSLTTAVGFLALNFSDAPPFWHLGNISAVGIVVAWLMSVTFLPAMLSLLPVRKPKASDTGGREFFSHLADFVVAYHKRLFYGLGAVALGLMALMPQIEFNDQWIEYFDESIEFRSDSDEVVNYFGFFPVEFSVLAPGEGGVSEPGYLEKLDEFAVWMRAQPNVTHVYSISDIMKRLNKNMHADDPSFYRLPDDRELAAQYLLLYEISLPYGLDLTDRINIDKSASRITATLGNVSTTETKKFLGDARAWLAANAPDYMKATVPTGTQVMFAYVAERNVHSMIRGNIIAIFVIGLIMMLTLKSWKLGLLSVIPNAMPIVAAFGTWALLVGTVGFSVASVASVSLGIVVDDTVHFLSKYMRGIREKGYGRAGAIKYAFETVGAALVVNTVILVIGFAYLATSHFKVNADMGLLTALAIAFALVFDFLFLPSLMLLGDKSSSAGPDDTEDALGNRIETGR